MQGPTARYHNLAVHPHYAVGSGGTELVSLRADEPIDSNQLKNSLQEPNAERAAKSLKQAECVKREWHDLIRKSTGFQKSVGSG